MPCQVKNYYQRQVESGKMSEELKTIAEDADEKRGRGESTGPVPPPIVQLKRRYDVPQGALSRPSSHLDNAEDLHKLSTITLQHSPSQLVQSTRFPTSTIAGASPHTQPLLQAPAVQSQAKHPAQSSTQTIVRELRGPALGYFNTENQRSASQATSPQQAQSQGDTETAAAAASRRSQIVAQEAEMERQKALRIEQQQNLQREQQEALERERQFQFKRESEVPQASGLSATIARPGIMAHSRSEGHFPANTPGTRSDAHAAMTRPEIHHSSSAQHLNSPSAHNPQPRHDLNVHAPLQSRPEPYNRIGHHRTGSNPNTPLDMRRPNKLDNSSLPRNDHLTHGQASDVENGQMLSSSGPSRQRGMAPIPAPPSQESRLLAPPVMPRQDTIRKTSNIMSLLNDDSNDRQKPAPSSKPRLPEFSSTTSQMQTPPPQHQNPHIPYSQSMHQLSTHVPHQQAQPLHSHYDRHSPSEPRQASALVPGRSYTPTSHDRGGLPPPGHGPPQHGFSQPRRDISDVNLSSHRDSNISGASSNSGTRAPVTHSGSMRHADAPYMTSQPAQLERTPLNHSTDQSSEREYYAHRQPQRHPPQQTGSQSNVAFQPSYDTSRNQPHAHTRQGPHFASNRSHAASPPPSQGEYSQPPSHTLHASRPGNYDNRYSHSPVATTLPPQYSPVTQGHHLHHDQRSHATYSDPQRLSRSNEQERQYASQAGQYGEIRRHTDFDRDRALAEDRERRNRDRVYHERERERERSMQVHDDSMRRGQPDDRHSSGRGS